MSALCKVRRHLAPRNESGTVLTIYMDVLALCNVSLHQRAEAILVAIGRGSALDHRVFTSVEMLADLIVSNNFPAASLCVVTDEL